MHAHVTPILNISRTSSPTAAIYQALGETHESHFRIKPTRELSYFRISVRDYCARLRINNNWDSAKRATPTTAAAEAQVHSALQYACRGFELLLIRGRSSSGTLHSFAVKAVGAPRIERAGFS